MSSTRKSSSVPKYRLHKPSGQAVVTLSGKDHYLGPHGTQASKNEYDRLVGEWMAAGRRLPGSGGGLTVTQLCIAYLRYAETYYRRDGKPTSELSCLRDALRPLRLLYGPTLACEFTPLSLKALRQQLIEDDLSRKVINGRVTRIRRVFKWAVSEDLLPPAVLQGLQAVDGLRRGRSEARETLPVQPVPSEHVEAVLPHVSRQVAAMIRLQLCTGMRPGEVVQMTAADIDRTNAVWTYTPRRHKTQHHGIERRVPLGPRAQRVLEPFLVGREAEAPLFNPRDAERERRTRQRLARRTPVQPSQVSRARAEPARAPGESYTTDSYRRAVIRGAEAAGGERWSPNQLRHSYLTQVERQFSLDAARACAGHTTPDTTSIYVQRDQSLAMEVAAKVG